jgi:hypothetical protein
MAYMNQEKKSLIAEQLKKVTPHNWKYSLSVENHSTIVCTIARADLDLVDLYTATQCSADVRASCLNSKHVQVNPYWWHDHFTGELAEKLQAIFAALNLGNWNRSEPMTDYFDVGHYVSLQFGRWDKPFEVKGE